MTTSVPPAVSVHGLVKRYGDVLALDYFDLDVRQGEIFGLLGPNGSGKTTAINCILALLTYDAGLVGVFGSPMTPTSYALKRRIGVVPQEVAVFYELTVEENIDYFCSLYVPDRRTRTPMVDEAIAFVGLDDYRRFRPGKLSGGLLRRLNIACGIAHRPDLIFFDEPTVAVDPQSRNAILEGIMTPARPRHHRRVHQPLHGGGRADLRPHPHHGPRPTSGARHRRGTETHDRRRRAHHRPDPGPHPRPPPGTGRRPARGHRGHLRRPAAGHPLPARRETNLIDILGACWSDPAPTSDT